MAENHYDYIIAGAGASGLSLAWQFCQPEFSNKKILLVDQKFSVQNEKTWCFWHDSAPPFSEIIHKKWTQTEIITPHSHVREKLSDFPYYCIKSGAFTKYIFNRLQKNDSFELLETPIRQIKGNKELASIATESGTFTGNYIFQSCFTPPQIKKSNVQYPIVQHFLGWEIKADKSAFNTDSFILMDFDESHMEGIAFLYLLPWSPTEALLEYTIFSPHPQKKSFYEKKLELYLFNRFNLKRIQYSIDRTEYGEIPMQDIPYAPFYAPRVINMGTVGGLTKPSTGYTFARIQQHCQAIVDSLIKEGTPALPPRSSFRYQAYDLWLLHIMNNYPRVAYKVFYDLFDKNSADEVFKFLGEKTSIIEDIKIMLSVPHKPFLKAIWNTKKRLYELFF